MKNKCKRVVDHLKGDIKTFDKEKSEDKALIKKLNKKRNKKSK